VTDTTCVRCGDIDDDHRTLFMRCGYEMDELQIPLQKHIDESPIHTTTTYNIKVCKRCRSQWLKAIKHWFENVEPKRETGSGIFIREFGDNVEITMEEWNAMRQRMAEESKL